MRFLNRFNSIQSNAAANKLSKTLNSWMLKDVKWKEEDAKWKEEDAKWKKGIDNWKDEITLWKNSLNQYENHWKQAGKTYEILVRDILKKHFGEKYASSFTIKNLYGLARLSAPKKVKYSKEKDTNELISNELTSVEHIARVSSLAHVSLKQIDQLELWYNAAGSQLKKKTLSEENKKKYYLLGKQLKKFNAIDTEEMKINFLSREPLGLYSFSSLILDSSTSQKGFIRELDIDARGDIDVEGKTVYIRVAEIKSGHDRQKAIIQLIKRLSLLHLGSTHFSPLNTFNFELSGDIITYVSKWDEISTEEINKIAKENGIIIPRLNTNIKLNIIDFDSIV